MFIVKSHWSGSRPRVSATLSIDAGLPLRHPVVALCHGDPVALDLQGWSLHVLQQITEGVDVEWVMTLVVGLGDCRVGQPARSPLSSLPA